MVIEDKTQQTVDEFVETSPDLTELDRFMHNGVRFLYAENRNGEEVFYHIDPNEYVSIIPLSDDPRGFIDANYTFSRLEDTGEKVMVDDEGVHLEWE